MDVERIIDEIEQLQEMFEAPDIRPLSWVRMIVALLFNSVCSHRDTLSGGLMLYGAAFWTLLLPLALLASPSSAAEQSPLPVIVANDNRTPSGNLKDSILNLRLELRQARWYAEAADGVYEDVYAFAEQGHPPQSSGPLLRMPQGTRIHASLHNLLPLAAKVYGLHSY